MLENKNYLKKYFFLYISSSYVKILGETNFHPREIPRSGSKAEDGEVEKKKRKKERRRRANDGNNNGQTHCKRHLGWHTQSHLGQFSKELIHMKH